jgi:nucleotide-binding universal stress UspA family protein
MTASLKQMLVHLDPSIDTVHRLALARELAGQHDAALSGLYATTPVFVGLPCSPEMSPAMAASLLEVDHKRRGRTHRMFDESLRAPGVAASWSETLEVPVIGAFAQQALHADLLVVGQRNPTDLLAAGVPADFAEAVMLASGRPALVVPYVACPARIGETVAIAWKETREAARAVAAAMPILKRARQVHIVCWDDEELPLVQGARLDLAGYLQLHGVRASWHRQGAEPNDLGEILLSRVFDLGADLLVMGCYGHSRAREWILGGTSRSILASMTLPVLMAH